MYVFGAVFETVVFSTLMLNFLLFFSFLRERPILLLLISPIPFALAHYTCWIYVLGAYFGGLILNFYYLNIYKKTKITSKAIVYVSLLHFLINMTGFLIARYILPEYS